MGRSSYQLAHGLAGMLIVDDDSAASADLPHEYGVDDVPIILQCSAVDAAGDLKYDFLTYNEEGVVFPVLVNGANVEQRTLTFAAGRRRVRLRLLNASVTDNFTVSRADGGPLTQVATEAAYLTAPTLVNSVRLVAGARAEVIVEVTGPVTLRADVETTWVEGGSGSYEFLRIDPPAKPRPVRPLPSALNEIARFDTSGLTPRELRMTWNLTTQGMGFNDVVGTTMEAMMASMIHVRLDETELWRVINTTELEHSFHLHGVPFQIVSLDGVPPTGVDLGWKDTVEVGPKATVEVAMQFTDYADPVYMYMIHCHLSPHEDEGMMAGVMVME